MTYGEIMVAFGKQFPGLKIKDMRPNGQYQLYIWIEASTNIIATYQPETQTFIVETTRKRWTLLD